MCLAALCILMWMIAIPAFGQGRIDPSLPPAPLTHTRTLLIFPGVDTVKDPDAVLPPLTTRQKYEIFWQRTFDISLPVEAFMFAAGSHAVNYSPHYGTDEGALAKRFGAYAGSIVGSAFFTDAFFPSIFHQDPRYFRKGHGSIPSRVWYAVKSEFVTRGDDGNMQFNISGVLGFGCSTALTNAWYPRNSITFDNTMQRLGAKIALSAVINLIREFGSTGNKTSSHP